MNLKYFAEHSREEDWRVGRYSVFSEWQPSQQQLLVTDV